LQAVLFIATEDKEDEVNEAEWGAMIVAATAASVERR
jgi:hypothetical protein